MTEEKLTVAEIALELNRSEETVRRWLRRGVLRGKAQGWPVGRREWRVTREDLEQFKRDYPNAREDME